MRQAYGLSNPKDHSHLAQLWKAHPYESKSIGTHLRNGGGAAFLR
jgi:hypothetical protein